ncbi:MAG: hypothetical protein OFPI_30030 [Osedax symbiont Rs2]|nr:MAG: hypothetical protein OFPI_30030 [Osedax symbiont Rs2]
MHFVNFFLTISIVNYYYCFKLVVIESYLLKRSEKTLRD